MFERLKFHHIILALLILCGAIRFTFLFAEKQLPVMWDARIYSAAALGLLYYTDHSDRFGHPESANEADSLHYKKEFVRQMRVKINGERIEWLYYSIPDMLTAQHYTFLSGPVYPIYLSAVFLTSPAADFTIVRILNVLIDCLCALLVILIARMLFGKYTAIIAGLIYCFYLPFILLTGMVSPDSITMLLTLLTLYFMMKWYDERKAAYVYLCGLVLGLLVLTRPTATLLCVPFLLGYIYDNRKEIKAAIIPFTKAVVPYVAVILPWLIIASLYFGQLTIRDPQYAGANIRSSSSISTEGYDLDYAEKDFWISPLMYTIKENPSGYAKLLVKKFVRLWSQPYNDFNESFIFNKKSSTVFHVLLVVTALFGIFYFIINGKKGLIFLLLIPAYYTFLHIIFHSLARYNLNAMPLMIIASSAIICKTIEYFETVVNRNAIIPVVWRLVLPVLGVLFVFLFSNKTAVVIFGAGAGNILLLLFKVLILIALLVYLVKELSKIMGFKTIIKFTGMPSAILVVLLIYFGTALESWAEWKIRLDKPNQSAGIKIFIPEDFRLEKDQIVRIAVDMTTNTGAKNPFWVTLGGIKKPFDLSQPPLSKSYYQKASYEVFEYHLNISKERMRAWRYFLIKNELFDRLADQNGFIEISISPGDTAVNGDFVNLYGNYSITEKDRALIPSVRHHSVERLVEKGDPRIWSEYILSSDSVISYYREDVNSDDIEFNDLSSDSGKQNGRFRIYIEVMKLGGSKYYF